MTNFPLNAELNLFVTHLDSEGPFLRIWAQTNKEDVENIERVMHQLNAKFSTGIGTPQPPSSSLWPGRICCALFEGEYYRAKILSADVPRDGYVVLFIDYGNTELVQPGDIRIIDGMPGATELQRVPPLCVDFYVAGVLPQGGSWNEQMMQNILKDLRYKEFPGRVNTMGRFRFVRLIYDNQDFSNILINQGLAISALPDDMMRAHACSQQVPIQHIQIPKPPMQMAMQPHHQEIIRRSQMDATLSPVMRNCNYQENWRSPTQLAQQPRIQPLPQNDDAAVFRSRILEIGSQHDVTVSYVEDGPLMFSVQVSSTAAELKNLMHHLNNSVVPQPLTEPPVIGTVCLGRYTVEKTLLRAVVMQVREHDCKVHYVDYGHVELLPYSDIYQLPRQYINPRVLSIRFTMSNVNELRISDQMKDYFKCYVVGKTFLLHVRPSEGSPLIQYGDLYENGHNVKEALRAIFGEAPIAWTPSKKLHQDSKEIVQVVYMESSVIYVQLDSDKHLVEAVARQINEYVTSAPPFKPNQLSKGLQCIALSSYDSQWYRAEITNVADDNVTVFYIDYGNEETIPATSLRSIVDKTLTKIPAQAIRCIISNYDNEIKPKLHDGFQTEIMKDQVAMVVRQLTPGGPIVDLFQINSDPLTNVLELYKNSVVNGNMDPKPENNNEKNFNSMHSSVNRRSNVKKQSTVGPHQKSKSQNVNVSRDDQNKWNHNQRSEPSRISDTNNSMDKGRMNNWRNEDDSRRHDNRYQNRDKEWSPNSGQYQNDRFSRNDGKNDRPARENRFERNDRYGDSNNRGGSDYRGGQGGFRNYGNNNPRTERNGSAEKTWSDKDSDSSRGSGGRRMNDEARGGGARGRRDFGRAPRENDDADRGNFRNSRTNGVSPRGRDNRREFGEINNENKQIGTWENTAAPVPKVISIPQPNITVGAVKNCELVYLAHPGDFHVQLSPDYLELEPVMANIVNIYENGGKVLEKSAIKPGVDCVALYSEDSIWYRATVQSVEENGATVRFVDYGNVEIVDFDKIKELEADCATLSAQAIACKLLGANKTTWDAEEIDKFSQLTGICLEAEFVASENNVFEVLLREVVDGTPTDKYINEEFCVGVDLTEAKNNARATRRPRQGPVVVTDYASLDDKWIAEEIAPGSKDNVIVTWFTNPDTFYCQTLAKKDEFMTMMNDIQRVYANRSPINEPLKVGSSVMAVFSEDGALYRAEVLELNKARGNIVRYVDFGNTAMVEPRNTYRVEKKYMTMPKQAVKCSLKNIVPANGTSWLKSNKQTIEKYFDADFECTFHEMNDGKYIVSLKKEGNVDVAGLLVENSLAAFEISANVSAEKIDLEVTEKPRVEDLPRFDISLLAGQILRAKISNVASATKFHIQLPTAAATEKIIDSYMAERDPKVMPRLSYCEVCVGAGCLVNTDEGWRRAVVVNCSRTTGFDVRLIDTGANEEISLDCMVALPGELSVMQNQAIECCLKNATTNIVYDERLRDRVENTNVIVAVDEVDQNRLIVKLYDTHGKSIKVTESEATEEICPICPMAILYSTQKVLVAHAEDSSSVWLKKLNELDVDSQFLSQLFEYYNVERDEDKLSVIAPGTLCAAKSFDENWYRAKIIQATETGALVQYIDYGNSEEVSLEFLRILAPQFHAQSQLAVEVALTVSLGGTKEQQQEILKTHIVDQDFTATIYNVHKKWVAELTNEEGKISEKLATLETVEVCDNHQIQEVVEEMVVGERYQVICQHTDNPSSFWLQRKEEIPAIEQLQERLQAEAANCPSLEGIPEENTLCLAMYSVDDMWYRAEVIVADSEITSVRFIDFGNTEVVYTGQSKSKSITDSLKSIKRYATKCRLDVIPYESEEWSCQTVQWFKDNTLCVENMEALVIADSSPRRVELFVNGRSLVDELVERNLASRISTEEELVEEIIEREVDPRAAYVSHAISPSEFWVQQEKYVGDLEVLADRFIVAEMFPRPAEIKEGLLCVAKFPEDGEWYRARVVTHSETTTEVIYIDYGNSAISTEIREIPEDVAAQPAFSKKCSLALPEGIEQWSEEACLEFVRMAADGATTFLLDVLEDREDTSIVRLTQDGADIVETLASLCKPEVPVIEERLPPLGEENSPNVVVSHVNSPSDFSIQAESSINELEIMANHLVAAESFLPLDKMEEGMICAAKFPEDDQWYRARILSHGDAGTEVFYIDYGNSAIVTELRVLPKDIVEKPVLSTHCSLRMPDDLESWSEKACEKFFELVNEGITLFQYEILEEREETTFVRLIIDGKDIVETLSELCDKKIECPVESQERPENENVTEHIVETLSELCDKKIASQEVERPENENMTEEIVETISGVCDKMIASQEVERPENEIVTEEIVVCDTKIESQEVEKLEHELVTETEVSLQEVTGVSLSSDETSGVEVITIEDSPTSNSSEFISTQVEFETNEFTTSSVIRSNTETSEDTIEPNVETSRPIEEFSGIEPATEDVVLEDKIVSDTLNNNKPLAYDSKIELSTQEVDVTNEDSSHSAVRKLSFADNTATEIISCESPVKQSSCPPSPKIPHSEKLVAAVVNFHENIDEIISVTEENIPK